MTRLLSTAARAVDSRRARSRQRKVGASEIGTCRRRAGYSHHGTPTTDVDESTSLKAIAGTWYHAGSLDTMRREWGTLIETTVEDTIVRGHVDAINLPNDWRVLAGLPEIGDAPEVIDVEDVKTRDDARAVDIVRIRGPKRAELYQAHIYASLLRRGLVGPLGKRPRKVHERALLEAIGRRDGDGLPVEVIRLRFMARTGQEDAEHPYEQPYDEQIAADAWSWVEQVATSATPDELPRDQDGPGLSIVCDRCPWLSECWGAVGEVKPQAQLIVTEADLASTLADYDRNRAAESEAKAAKDLARAKLDAADPAIYVTRNDAPGFRLGWSGGRAVPAGEEPDLERMLVLFEDAGISVPMREVPATTTARTISVVPWTPPDPACGKPVGDPEPWEGPDGSRWIQDRPRSGWTRLDIEADNQLTAGQFAKAYPEYVDPRDPCILKPGHSTTKGHLPAAAVVELDVDAPAPDPFASEPI